jgi:hypothetical protein
MGLSIGEKKGVPYSQKDREAQGGFKEAEGGVRG